MSNKSNNNPDEVPVVAGEGSADVVSLVLGWAFSLMRFAMFVSVPLVVISADLYLSGAFMNNYSVQYGENGAITAILPYVFTLGTSGLQAAINARTRAGFNNSSLFGKGAIVVGWFMIVLDTLTDIGGWTALYTGDVNIGANILPPDWQHDYMWMAITFLVILVCGGQEKLLPLLFGRFEVLRGDDDAPGAGLVRIGEACGGFLYSWISAILMPIGLVSVLVLDVVLAPSFLGQATGTPVAWVISGMTTAIGWLLWEQAQKVTFARMPDGSLGLSRLTTGAKITMVVAWVFALVDVVIDVAGYTTLVYGEREGSFLPPVVSATWIITATIVGVSCFAGDVLVKELLNRPGKSKSKGGSTTDADTNGGFVADDDGDDGFGFDFKE
jgi:hypothetical protein